MPLTSSPADLEQGEAAVEAAETLRYVLSASGYGFGGEYCAYVHREAPPLCDADCVVLCDALVSGLGRRCLWIDLSDSENVDPDHAAASGREERAAPAAKQVKSEVKAEA